MLRRKVVNTYCRACPRQVADKHHFLTPDTPIVEELELPSHLLRDSLTSSTQSTARQNSLAELSATSSRGRRNSRAGGRVQTLQSDPTVGEGVSHTPTPGERRRGKRVGGSATTIDSGVRTHSGERLLRKSQLVTSRRSGLLVGRKASDQERLAGCGSDQSSVTESGGAQAVGKRRRRQGTVSSACKKRKKVGQEKMISRHKVKTVSQTSSVSGGHEGLNELDGDWAVIDKVDIPFDNQSCVQIAPSCNLDTVSMELTCSSGRQSHQGRDSREVRQ